MEKQHEVVIRVLVDEPKDQAGAREAVWKVLERSGAADILTERYGSLSIGAEPRDSDGECEECGRPGAENDPKPEHHAPGCTVPREMYEEHRAEGAIEDRLTEGRKP